MFANYYVAFEEIYPITLILFSEIYQIKVRTTQVNNRGDQKCQIFHCYFMHY